MVGNLLLLASGEIVMITAGRGDDFYAATVLYAPQHSSYQPGGYAIQISSADIAAARTVRVSAAVATLLEAESTLPALFGKIRSDAKFELDGTRWTITDVSGVIITAEDEHGETKQFRWHEVEQAMILERLWNRHLEKNPS